MSERTFNKFKEGLTTLFFDYKLDYDEFVRKGKILLEKAQKHREISEREYMMLFNEYDNMSLYLQFAFMEDLK